MFRASFPRLASTIGQKCQQQYSAFSSTSRNRADFTHAVIGGGVVGIAIARRLAAREDTSVVLVERNSAVGMETSSRNSEVIHAGLYYPVDSLKARFCIRGKQLLYPLCQAKQIPHKNTGKWILAQNEEQQNSLVTLHERAKALGVPTTFLTPEQAIRQEPDVRAHTAVLESPTTGIIDAHSLMISLLTDFEDLGGDTALMTRVTDIEALCNGRSGFKIHSTLSSEDPPQDMVITAESVINSAGHGACAINNMLVPQNRHQTPYFAKGTYFSYGASHPRPSRLLYPAPKLGLGGLGTHLTLDLTGRPRFGPDVEWVSSADDLKPSDARLQQALPEIKEYLPGINEEAVVLDYCGIRPKLKLSGEGFVDFVIRKEDDIEGFVNLLGIESPGLTSSLAIAEFVEELLYK